MAQEETVGRTANASRLQKTYCRQSGIACQRKRQQQPNNLKKELQTMVCSSFLITYQLHFLGALAFVSTLGATFSAFAFAACFTVFSLQAFNFVSKSAISCS